MSQIVGLTEDNQIHCVDNKLQLWQIIVRIIHESDCLLVCRMPVLRSKGYKFVITAANTQSMTELS